MVPGMRNDPPLVAHTLGDDTRSPTRSLRLGETICRQRRGRTVRGQPGRGCNEATYPATVTLNPAPGPPDAERELPLPAPFSLRLTLGIHARGRGDPSMRFEVSGSAWRATRTPDGPVTLFIEAREGSTREGSTREGSARVRAWGPGSAWAVAGVEGLLGLDDEPGLLVPHHPAVAAAVRRSPGLRIGRTGAVLEALVPAILEQKVTGDEARRTLRGLIRVYGEDAPGPPGLRLLPAPDVLARLPYHAFHPLGLEQRRAELVKAVCREAARLERLGEAAAGPGATPEAREHAYAALRIFPGIGPWTAAEVGMRALGDPDAVSVGDFHIPNMVAWALAGEPRGTDERMLELLEPYRGQRGRVIRLLEASGVAAPRRGPRMPTRRIAGL
jgi:3-methyladenine DNA glycosylase/8-oxoguanine DNA glycosylase